ncbi:hypothetical protein PanWU01x14_093310 [Parasponia andersonii]|uniref:Uncharacterized protein n=1 Tax=Parasponia andersonii TaxID=3476 RepID=A0A2P5D619_PARAD|nr:hypothetical protein PanWU01x14_093310 [Parasponia andersonii]
MEPAAEAQRLAHPYIMTTEDEVGPSSTPIGPKGDKPKSPIQTWIDPQPSIIKISSSKRLLTPTLDQLQATLSVN